jgi:processive 1,2-diacylglycerol beta-glucosyltransferase
MNEARPHEISADPLSDGARILLLSLKVGSGHVRAAQAVAEAIHERRDDAKAPFVELLALMPSAFRAAFTTFYGSLIAHFPTGWKLIYEATRRQSPAGFSRRFAAWITARNTRRVIEEVQRFQPEAIVCTHFTAADAIASAKRKKLTSAPLCVVITDIDLHSAWLHRGVDCYCVATESIAAEMSRHDLSGASVHVTGIPISPAFSREYPPRAEMRVQLGLNPDLHTILVTGGGCGLGALDAMARLLLRRFPRAQVLAVAGGNQGMEKRLREIAAGAPNLRPFGFVSNMHELMAASDFIITKPGGLTCSECLAMGLPAVLTRPIPGQEERNCEFMVSSQSALHARNESELLIAARAMLEDDGLRQYMRSRSRSLARRQAAFAVADVALRYCKPRASALHAKISGAQRPQPVRADSNHAVSYGAVAGASTVRPSKPAESK